MHEFTATNKYQDFACPEYPPPSSNSQVKLPYFIAYGLHHTRWSCSQPRLKVHFPIARGSLGYKLFVSAFMLASSKVICDDTYSNTSWSIVIRGMFQLREINQMEGEMCQYLELNVDPVTLQETILVCRCSNIQVAHPMRANLRLLKEYLFTCLLTSTVHKSNGTDKV